MNEDHYEVPNINKIWAARWLNVKNVEPQALDGPILREKTKGQQLKGKIVSEFSHFFTIFTLFHNFSLGTFPFKTKGFSSRRTEEKNNNKKNRTNRCCTLVVARLSSSDKCVKNASKMLWARTPFGRYRKLLQEFNNMQRLRLGTQGLEHSMSGTHCMSVVSSTF